MPRGLSAWGSVRHCKWGAGVLHCSWVTASFYARLLAPRLGVLTLTAALSPPGLIPLGNVQPCLLLVFVLKSILSGMSTAALVLTSVAWNTFPHPAPCLQVCSESPAGGVRVALLLRSLRQSVSFGCSPQSAYVRLLTRAHLLPLLVVSWWVCSSFCSWLSSLVLW